MRTRPVVAIDGPSGAGKSTVARAVASALGFHLVDTGAIYRAVAWLAATAGVDLEDGEAVAGLARAHAFDFDAAGNLRVDGQTVENQIRTAAAGSGASTVAKHGPVRSALLSVQRRLGEAGGVVMDGRDIGTVVFPDAEAKFFLTASDEIRARRRLQDLKSRGHESTLDQVLKEQQMRDERDEKRPLSPLRRADDAMVIDCGAMTIDEVVEQMIGYISTKFPLTSKLKA